MKPKKLKVPGALSLVDLATTISQQEELWAATMYRINIVGDYNVIEIDRDLKPVNGAIIEKYAGDNPASKAGYNITWSGSALVGSQITNIVVYRKL